MRNLLLRTVDIWEELNGSMLAIAINYTIHAYSTISLFMIALTISRAPSHELPDYSQTAQPI